MSESAASAVNELMLNLSEEMQIGFLKVLLPLTIIVVIVTLMRWFAPKMLTLPSKIVCAIAWFVKKLQVPILTGAALFLLYAGLDFVGLISADEFVFFSWISGVLLLLYAVGIFVMEADCTQSEAECEHRISDNNDDERKK